eukprot:CAMPEP_0177596680 /NCGR_PEP_ID=MMETSP0419_2-20121207/11249_1 /TAXON_ID=582737 /ORGANISM="Tetraselmis sp., Strain GSL018" /LENGTH=204 /DNA_ID=CAMNT_0019088683 /DNA_START=191 /DNA_END=807 /DNA_ORIENTATION=+
MAQALRLRFLALASTLQGKPPAQPGWQAYLNAFQVPLGPAAAFVRMHNNTSQLAEVRQLEVKMVALPSLKALRLCSEILQSACSDRSNYLDTDTRISPCSFDIACAYVNIIASSCCIGSIAQGARVLSRPSSPLSWEPPGRSVAQVGDLDFGHMPRRPIASVVVADQEALNLPNVLFVDVKGIDCAPFEVLRACVKLDRANLAP